eukprot:TRINITY_DN352_c1_g2_i3.p1 TRINITY_DN352_c1_g2~~TRINITY_DN352_c1_g2_i3.p1  ORF type:complete len:159 (-),score=2.57 TRINITY_DN352_c1_g2_i3:87-563(-)
MRRLGRLGKGQFRRAESHGTHGSHGKTESHGAHEHHAPTKGHQDAHGHDAHGHGHDAHGHGHGHDAHGHDHHHSRYPPNFYGYKFGEKVGPGGRKWEGWELPSYVGAAGMIGLWWYGFTYIKTESPREWADTEVKVREYARSLKAEKNQAEEIETESE